MVARQRVHPDFIGMGFLGSNLMRETPSLGPFVSKLIDRLRTNESEFAESKLFRGISLREIPIFVPLIEETSCQRFGWNL